MNTQNNNELNLEGKTYVGLRYRPEDWGGSQSDYITLSMKRIAQNERLRNFMEAYLNDVELIGWENLSDDEINDILLESILNHNSRFCDCSWYDRLQYKGVYYRWKKFKERLVNYVNGKTEDDELIGMNIGGYIPLCIKTSRVYRAETEYFCRNAITKDLVRVKQSELTRLAKGEEVSGLRPDKVDSSRKVGYYRY